MDGPLFFKTKCKTQYPFKAFVKNVTKYINRRNHIIKSTGINNKYLYLFYQDNINIYALNNSGWSTTPSITYSGVLRFAFTVGTAPLLSITSTP